MASNAPAPVPAQQQQQPKPTRASLSYEEISKLFSLPIAEAASILGVCTSVLKRICRSHGIVRWPYRKLVSGKSGDDVKNSEKAKELHELSKAAKQKAFSSSGPSTQPSNPSHGTGKPPQGGPKAGAQVSPPGKQNAPSGAPGLIAQTKAIPTYMDDFKYGFPSSGLSSETTKWWGTSSHTDCAPEKDGSRELAEAQHDKGMTDDDELDWGADEGEAEAEAEGAVTAGPSAQLCSLRRKAVDDGRELLNGGGRRGQQEFSWLSKRQKRALVQAFGASLPGQWRSQLV